MEAAEALGKMGPAAKAAVPILLHVARNAEEDTDVRSEAILALGTISPKDDRVLKSLQDTLEIGDPKDDDLLRAAATALGNAGGDAASAVPHLVSLLEESYDDDVRAAAARSLGLIGKKSDAVVAALVRALEEEPSIWNEDLRREAATALGKLHATSAVNLLQRVSASSDEDKSVRRAATEAVRRIAAKE